MISYLFSCITAIITFGMAVLQLALTLGAPLGEYALGGRYKVLPPPMRLVSGAYCLVFIFVGLIYLQKGKVINFGFSPRLVNIVLIINTIFLAYAIVGNGLLTQSIKEKYLMTPLSALQFVLSLFVLLFR